MPHSLYTLGAVHSRFFLYYRKSCLCTVCYGITIPWADGNLWGFLASSEYWKWEARSLERPRFDWIGLIFVCIEASDTQVSTPLVLLVHATPHSTSLCTENRSQTVHKMYRKCLSPTTISCSITLRWFQCPEIGSSVSHDSLELLSLPFQY